ncbi:MAG: DinB family protein [Ginsengibacter sp.]
MQNDFRKEFTEQAVYRNEENTKRIIKCLEEIDEAETGKAPNYHSNSIANLILHLCGNINQYIISALGNNSDERERDQEFSIKEGYTKNEVAKKLTITTTEANRIISNISNEDLGKIYVVQGFNLSGIGIIIHVTEHFSYHTGQIAFWVKQLKNWGLGFYAGIELNMKNKN